MHPKNWLKSLLKGKGEPVLNFLDAPFKDGQEEYLSAANLWNLALERAQYFSKNQEFTEKVFFNSMNSKACLIDFFAVVILDGTVCIDQNHQLDETHWESDLGEIANFRGGMFIRTSGTASRRGRPVFLSWPQIISQVENHADYFAETVGFNRLSVLPKHHCFGLILDLLVGLKLRQTIHLSFEGHQRFRQIPSWIRHHEIQFIALTPRPIEMLSEHLESLSENNRRLTIHLGGASLNREVIESLEKKGILVIEGYGLTEAGPGVLLDGTPIGCEVQLKPMSGSAGGVGELWIKTPTLGEFDNKTLDEFGYFNSGDLALFQNGRYKIVGRNDDKIKKNDGTWVDIRSIENDLKKRFSINQAMFRLPLNQGSDLIILGEKSSVNIFEMNKYLKRHLGYSFNVKVISSNTHTLNQISGIPAKDSRSAFERWEKEAG